MGNHIKLELELEQNKLRLEFFKVKSTQEPNHINRKWVEIYAERVKKLERQLQRVQAKTQTKLQSRRAH